MSHETCTVCGNPVIVICQRGSGFCSQNCAKRAAEDK